MASRNLTGKTAPSKPGIIDWLRREWETHPELAARFAAEVRDRADVIRLARPQTDPRVALREAVASRLREALRRPIGQTLVDLLRDEGRALEGLVDRLLPQAGDPTIRQGHRVATFQVASHPVTQKQPASEALERLLGRVVHRARKLARAERQRGAKGLDYHATPPEIEQTQPEPPEDADLAHLRAVAKLNDGEARVLRAEYQLLRADPGLRKAPLAAVAQLAGVTPDSAKTLRSRYRAKLREARSTGRLSEAWLTARFG